MDPPDHQGKEKTGSQENLEHREFKDPQGQRVCKGHEENLDCPGAGVLPGRAKWDRRELREKMGNLDLRA